MTLVPFVLIATGIILLSACKPKVHSPFSVDTAKGSFTIEDKGRLSGSYQVEINGFNALENGHIFRGSDSLVVISSVGGLDVLLVFKGAVEQANMLISLINPTDISLEISRLDILYAATHASKDSHISIRPAGESKPLWQWVSNGSEGIPGCSLKLSGSSILLLPEERIVLPPLYFFSHLCSE